MVLTLKDLEDYIKNALYDKWEKQKEWFGENKTYNGTICKLKTILNTEDVAVVIDAHHLCVSSRGVSDVNSSTVTAEYGGAFITTEKREEFLKYISLSK